MVPWSRVRDLLETNLGYWLATTDPDGRPHLVQQWGAWVEDRWWFEGSPQTRWARNLSRDPRAVMSLERGSEIVIVYGTVRLGAPTSEAVAQRIARSYVAKYGREFGYRPTAEAIQERGMNSLTPSKALSWDVKRFSRSPTRFRFDEMSGHSSMAPSTARR